MLLEMDFEGAEWNVLEFLDRDRFRERASEFPGSSHTLTTLSMFTVTIMQVSKIVDNIPVPKAIEVNYALASIFDLIESADILPTHLDDRCNQDEPDLFLGSFKYKCQ